MDTKQKENWIDVDEIHKIYDDLRIEVKQIFASKKVMNYETIMSFFLVALLGGMNGLAPRRSLDYGLMKIRNYNTDTDNYYRGGKFFFNVYKTAEKYGLQIVDVPTELNLLIKRWIKINTDNDYLLFSKNGNHLSSSQITRILNKVFGKNISTDILRHVFITNKFGNMPALKDMEQIAQSMGHSVGTQMEYIKHE